MKFQIEIDATDLGILPKRIRDEIVERLPQKLVEADRRIERKQFEIERLKEDRNNWSRLTGF